MLTGHTHGCKHAHMDMYALTYRQHKEIIIPPHLAVIGGGRKKLKRKLVRTENKKAQLSLTNPRTLAKSLHGLRKSSGVVSCIASLLIDNVPTVSY